MPTIKLKPTTPSRRQMTLPTFEELTKFSPEKSLVVIKKKNAGRNANGKITVRHRGGGNKQKYRIIDFQPSERGSRQGHRHRIRPQPYRLYRTASD